MSVQDLAERGWFASARKPTGLAVLQPRKKRVGYVQDVPRTGALELTSGGAPTEPPSRGPPHVGQNRGPLCTGSGHTPRIAAWTVRSRVHAGRAVGGPSGRIFRPGAWNRPLRVRRRFSGRGHRGVGHIRHGVPCSARAVYSATVRDVFGGGSPRARRVGPHEW